MRNKNENTAVKNHKTLKIILIAVVSALLVCAAVVLCLHYIKSIPEISTDYGTLKNISINSENSLTVRLSAPYSANEIEYASDKSQKCLLSKKASSEQYEAVVSDIKYDSLKNDDIQRGAVEITFEVKSGFGFEDKTSYVFEMPDKTVTEKKTGVSVGSVKVVFSTDQTVDKYSAKIENETDFELKTVHPSKAGMETDGGKNYIVLTFNEKEAVNLNKKGIKEKTTGFTYSYKKESIKMVTLFEEVTSVVDKSAGTVTIKCPIKEDDVIEGTEYVVFISKGFLINDDFTLGSEEMTETFTYMG